MVYRGLRNDQRGGSLEAGISRILCSTITFARKPLISAKCDEVQLNFLRPVADQPLPVAVLGLGGERKDAYERLLHDCRLPDKQCRARPERGQNGTLSCLSCRSPLIEAAELNDAAESKNHIGYDRIFFSVTQVSLRLRTGGIPWPMNIAMRVSGLLPSAGPNC
jgi:hypothetical protein